MTDKSLTDPTGAETRPPGAQEVGQPERTGIETTNWLGVVTIALGIFIMITIEELPIGVLTLVSDDLATSQGAMGWAVTLPGLLAGLVSVITPMVIGRTDRRLLLIAAMALMALGCLGSLLAPTFGVLLLSRIPVGLAIGLFWCLAPPVGIRLVPSRRRALATSVIFSGASGALVLGVPLGSFLGSTFGWRISFAVVGAIGLLVGLLMWLLLDRMTVDEPTRFADLVSTVRRPAVATGVVVTTLVVTAQMGSYTFASPILQQVAGVAVLQVSGMLLAYGVAGMVGNFAVGLVSSRAPAVGVILVAIGLTVVLSVYGLLADDSVSTALMMVAWGLFGGACGTALQTWIFHAAPDRTEVATALNNGSFNVSIAVGALLGGLVLDAVGPDRLLLVSAAGLAVGAIVMSVGSRLAARGADTATTP